VAWDAIVARQRQQALDGAEARRVATRRTFESVGLGKFGQRSIDFPEQHRGAGAGTAVSGSFPVDDDDLVPATGEAFGDHGAGDPRTDN
jgi:hypothetical protein